MRRHQRRHARRREFVFDPDNTDFRVTLIELLRDGDTADQTAVALALLDECSSHQHDVRFIAIDCHWLNNDEFTIKEFELEAVERSAT